MPEEITYVSAFKRSTAIFIDILITSFLRIITAQILGFLWFNQQIIDFLKQFKEKFGTEIIGNTPEQMDYIIHHHFIKSAVIFYFAILMVGALYHSLLNSSNWSATIGKRLMNIILIKSEGRKLSFHEALWHYFLSLFPWLFIIYIIGFQSYHNVTIFKAITADFFNLLFGLVTIAWIQIQTITKRKVTAHDMFCKTVMIEGKVGGRFPWSKKL